jgi:hypothetical protein
MLKVQKTTVKGRKVFGVTDGKKWFWWAYVLEESARKMVTSLSPEKYRQVNVVHDKAYEVSEIRPEDITIGG